MNGIAALILSKQTSTQAILSRTLADYSEIQILPLPTDEIDAIEIMRKVLPDVLFADISLVSVALIFLFESLQDYERPALILITERPELAVKAFEMGALDILLTPLHEDRIRISLQRALKRIENQKKAKLAKRLLSVLTDSDLQNTRFDEFPRRISVKVGSRIEFVDVRLIDWIEAADQYVKIHAGAKEYLLRMRMAALERQLNPKHFFRIHRHSIINLQSICEVIQKSNECCAVLKNGKRVAVSRFRKNQFLGLLGTLSDQKQRLMQSR